MLQPLLAVLRRLVVLLGGLCLLAGAGWVAAAVAGQVPPVAVSLAGAGFHLDPAAGPLWPTWGGVVVVGLVAGLAALALAVSRSTRRRDDWLDLRGAAGPHDAVTSIAMSRRSVEALVAWQARQLRGVRGVVPQVDLAREGWTLHLLVELWLDAPVAEVTDVLRQRLFEALPHHTGLPIAKLQIDLVVAGEDGQRRVA